MKSNNNKKKYLGFISKNNIQKVNASLLSSLLVCSFTLNTPMVSAEELSATNQTSNSTSSATDTSQAVASTTAASTKASDSSSTTPAAINVNAVSPNSSGDPMVLTMDSAIKLAIDNNLTIKQMNNNADLSIIQRDSYNKSSNDLMDANRTVSGGFNKVTDAENNQALLESNIKSLTDSINLMVSKGTPETNSDLATLRAKLAYCEQTLATIKAALPTAQTKVYSGSANLEAAKRVIAASLSNKLNISELNSLDSDQTGKLLNKMAGAAYLVNTAAKDIARNQVVLLIQKDYYDVLKTKRLMAVKEESMKRGQTQYDMAKASYDVGAKAKDDMLLANIYYTSTQLEYEKARTDYQNALLTLKKDLNVPLNTNLSLNDVYTTEITSENLDTGIKTGMENRIEIIKANAQYEVYKLDLELVDNAYGSDSDRHNEAQILLDNMDLEKTKTKNEVESSIRQSYENYMLAQDMLNTSKNMVAQAKETVDIAKFKYDEGFNGDSTLMTKLDLQASTGTMLEVISAEENLTTVQEKYEEILYSYNLAKSKYYNDICNLKY